MQELVLIQPGRAAEKEFAQEAAQAALRREFEERLAECGPLAYRVARGVLRNSADAEDVAQEALLRAYRRFERLRDRARFRAWLVRITFRLGDRPSALFEAPRSSRNALVAIDAAAFDGRPGGHQRISGASRPRDGRASGETPAGPFAGGDAGALARRSGGDAWLADGNGEIKIVFCAENS